MTDSAALATDLRDRILASPELILDDLDVMRALASARERSLGENVVDLRGLAMERLEQRLDRLEDTHRFVVSAAYENLSGTQMIQRAVLRLLEPDDFGDFLALLNGEIAEILRVEQVRLVLESQQAADEEPELGPLGAVLRMAPPGFVAKYGTSGRNSPMRPVILRAAPAGADALYGDDAIASEALMRLDLGTNRLPGMLALGSRDGQQFRASHGTDLLAFLASAFERMLRRWLA